MDNVIYIMIIAIALSPEQQDTFTLIEMRAKKAGHSLLQIPLDVHVGNGFFKSRSSDNPDLIILDADIPEIKTSRRIEGGEIFDVENVSLPPDEFIKSMRKAGVDVPILALAETAESKQAVLFADADRFLTYDTGPESIIVTIFDLLAQSVEEADFMPEDPDGYSGTEFE